MTPMNDSDLHPSTVAIIEALLDSALEGKVAPPISEEALARYACGWITPEEKDAVLAALVTSSDLRDRLIQMTEALNYAGQSISKRNAIFESDSALKLVMVAALKSTSKVLANWKEACTIGPAQPGLREEEQRSLRS
jgi:hypothetical protein